MQTFLEFVIASFIGPPARDGGSAGESYWKCPFHDDSDPSLHSLPHKRQYKDRWKCFGCGARGDAADFLSKLFPDRKWPERKKRLAELKKEFEQGQGQEKAASPSLFISGETGRVTGPILIVIQEQPRDEKRDIEIARSDLSVFEQSILAEAGNIFAQVKAGNPSAKISLQSLADYALHFEKFKKETDLHHLENCTDPECKAIVCQAARIERAVDEINQWEKEAVERYSERN